MNVQLIAAGGFIVYLIAAWTTAKLLGLGGESFWIVGGLLSAMGISAYGVFIWFAERKKRQSEEAGAGDAAAPAAADGGGESSSTIKTADARLAGSKATQGAGVANLPTVLVVGETGSVKTSTVIHSGLEPELLAGQSQQESQAVPTRGINIWLARQTIFLEAGGPVYQDNAAWTALVKQLTPGRLKSAGGSGQAPRGVLLCVDIESFAKPGASEAMAASARVINARLGEISQQLGISFPVYVLFTKLDRLPFFHDFVRNLTFDEASQVFGVTLPIEPPSQQGVYAEQETRRLSEKFSELTYSLCDQRIPFLTRETEADKLPGAYEFPREFRKLRQPLVQFLVDAFRPSQLRAGPFLRGFYFSGVRPVFVSDSIAPVAAPRPAESQQQGLQGATRMFRVGMEKEIQQQQAMSAPQISSRKVPQWSFLGHLFNDVILADRDAFAASGSSTKTAVLHRVLFSVAAALLLIASIGFLVSFVGNRGLAGEAKAAAEALPPGPPPAELANVEQLQKLETLRLSLERLTGYEQQGAPFRLRMGLYTGHDLYPEVRCIYYQRLQQLLLAQASANIRTQLERLPSAPQPTDEYGPVYDSLKAHLVMTSNRDRSTKAFLGPVLLARWSAGKQVDPPHAQLAQRQFEFFAEDVKTPTPCYAAQPDAPSVDRSRRYLAQFSGTESVYRFMLADAARKNPPVNYNREIQGSEEVIVNNRDVDGAFSLGGWDFMQKALRSAANYFGGEEWVMGPYKPAAFDRAKLEKELGDRYVGDFIKAWRQYLRNTQFQTYKDLNDAAQKLNVVSGNTTPLLALFWLATKHTSVEDPRVKEALQPVHIVVPPPAKVVQYIWPTTTPYIQQLISLQGVVEKVSQNPTDPSIPNQTRAPADAARLQTRQIAQAFRLDLEAKTHETVQRILEEPITALDRLVRGMGPDQLNAKGRALCGPFGEMTKKFPFNATAQQEVTLQELSQFLRPKEGAVWVFYDQNLKQHLKREGTAFVPAPDAPFPLSAAFMNWFNQVTRFSEAVYSAGTAEPKLVYSLMPVPSDQIQSMKLAVDGQSVTFSGTARGQAQQITWPGAGRREFRMDATLAGGSPFQLQDREGLWSVFRFFADADQFTPVGSGYQLGWVVRQGREQRPVKVGGKDLAYSFILDTRGAPPVFNKEYLAGLKCVAQVAR